MNARQTTPGRVGRRRAFTVLELITVIVLLGLIAVFVGGPTLSYISEVRTRAAAARLASDIRYLQRLSLGSGLRTWLVLNRNSNNYQLYIEDRANLGKVGRVPVSHPLDKSTNAVQLGVNPFVQVSMTAVNINGTSELEFDSFGVPYDANGMALSTSGVVTLTGGITVAVYPIGGMVERNG